MTAGDATLSPTLPSAAAAPTLPKGTGTRDAGLLSARICRLCRPCVLLLVLALRASGLPATCGLQLGGIPGKVEHLLRGSSALLHVSWASWDVVVAYVRALLQGTPIGVGQGVRHGMVPWGSVQAPAEVLRQEHGCVFFQILYEKTAGKAWVRMCKASGEGRWPKQKQTHKAGKGC